LPFTVTVLPTLTGIAPSTGLHGSAVTVTLTGTHLTGATHVNVSGSGVTVSNLVPVSATTLKATFTIASTALHTARSVAVVTPGGTSGNVTFTVH
jgi:hypothetical protein